MTRKGCVEQLTCYTTKLQKISVEICHHSDPVTVRLCHISRDIATKKCQRELKWNEELYSQSANYSMQKGGPVRSENLSKVIFLSNHRARIQTQICLTKTYAYSIQRGQPGPGRSLRGLKIYTFSFLMEKSQQIS